MNVKDIISAVVTSMKTLQTGLTIVANAASPYLITGLTQTNKLFVGQRVKVIGGDEPVTSYCTISIINSATEVTVTTGDLLTESGKGNNTGSSLQPILVFDHGHPIEVVNTIKQYTENDTLKYESFPRICLFHDFEEKLTFEKQVSLNLVIVTDTAAEYSAPQRYTYSFDPILIPLYDLFIRQLSDSPYIGSTDGNYFKHTKIDRLFWGKNGLYGNTGNIFNDFIDAIEISNLELILINC